MLTALAQHLANPPAAGVLIALVLALALFAVATVMAVLARAWYAALTAAGLTLLVVSFLVT